MKIGAHNISIHFCCFLLFFICPTYWESEWRCRVGCEFKVYNSIGACSRLTAFITKGTKISGLKSQICRKGLTFMLIACPKTRRNKLQVVLFFYVKKRKPWVPMGRRFVSLQTRKLSFTACSQSLVARAALIAICSSFLPFSESFGDCVIIWTWLRSKKGWNLC